LEETKNLLAERNNFHCESGHLQYMEALWRNISLAMQGVFLTVVSG
jgi:hypothetical protein